MKKKDMTFEPSGKEHKMIEHPDLERIQKDYHDLNVKRSLSFTKYFLRNVFLCLLLMAGFFFVIYLLLKAKAGV